MSRLEACGWIHPMSASFHLMSAFSSSLFRLVFAVTAIFGSMSKLQLHQKSKCFSRKQLTSIITDRFTIRFVPSMQDVWITKKGFCIDSLFKPRDNRGSSCPSPPHKTSALHSHVQLKGRQTKSIQAVVFQRFVKSTALVEMKLQAKTLDDWGHADKRVVMPHGTTAIESQRKTGQTGGFTRVHGFTHAAVVSASEWCHHTVSEEIIWWSVSMHQHYCGLVCQHHTRSAGWSLLVFHDIICYQPQFLPVYPAVNVSTAASVQSATTVPSAMFILLQQNPRDLWGH